MSEKVVRTRVRFGSGGVELVGYPHRPADKDGKIPCVVMGHGFSGTQDRLFDTAGCFAEAGFAALTFDYRSFGESGGEPRQVVNVKEQLEDWRAAIRLARGLEGVDPERVALWGSSLGGGHVVSVAAEDPRVAAVVAQTPFNGFPRGVEGRSAPDTLRLFWAMGVDAARGRMGLSPYYVPMVGRPGEVAHRLAMPLLVCMAEDDRETPEETTRQLAERAPRGELRRYPGTHFDFYRDPVRRRVLADQIGFLRTHLAAARNHA